MLKPGIIGWVDLTVEQAKEIRDFYRRVVGWQFGPVDMGDYLDFTMTPPGTKEAVAGVCHARGANADLPPQWLIYITVEDLDQSLADCEELGGEILVQPRRMGEDRFCVIKDPAGAVCALYESASEH